MIMAVSMFIAAAIISVGFLGLDADIFNTVLGVGAILGGLGYAIGQFWSSRRKGVSDSLATALNEIAALNTRAERLEGEMLKMTNDLASSKQENAMLRSLVTGGQPVLDAIERTAKQLEDFSRREHEKTRAAIAQIHKETSPDG